MLSVCPTSTNSSRLILASQSPRRAQLLQEHGFTFSQVDPLFADPPQPKPLSSPGQTAEYLARQKALSLRTEVDADAVILAADTICVAADGRLIGQPADRDEARRIIRSFRNCAHQVVTAVALMGAMDPMPTSFVDAARVFVGYVSNERIEAYLDQEQWQGKAGGYNLFERQDAGWPITVQGDPTTVVGLPKIRLIAALRQYGLTPSLTESGKQDDL
jgi:septum formation protein